MQDELKINKREIIYSLGENGSEVELRVDGREGLFLVYFEQVTAGMAQWLPKQLCQIYSMSHNKLVWTFQHRYVLTDSDHSLLLAFLQNFLRRHVQYSICYSVARYQRQVQLMMGEMKENGECISVKLVDGQETKWLLCLVDGGNAERVGFRLQRLRQFTAQTLIYCLDDYFSRTKLAFQEYEAFARGLIENYSKAIKKVIKTSLSRFQLENQLQINNIRYFNNSERDIANKFKSRAGIVFEIFGYEQCFGKFYQSFEKWLDKLNWMILEVDEIECCLRTKINHWMMEKRNVKAVLISNQRSLNQRVVVFAPKKDKAELERQLCTATRIVTGREYPAFNFQLISKFKKQFKRFLGNEKGQYNNLKIYGEYILVDCDPLSEMKFRKLVGQFLEEYNEQEVVVSEFKTPFQIAILSQFYSKTNIKVSPISLYVSNNMLYRLNSKKKSEQAETELSDIFKLMRKELVYKPLLRPLSKKIDHFEVSLAPKEWMTPECLQTRRYKLTDKINISVRSYGSIVNSDSDCTFIVTDFSKCSELRQILREQQASNNFEQTLKKVKIMTMPLRFVRYFENITVWSVNADSYRHRRSNFGLTRLKEDIESLLHNSGNLMQMKFMFPAQSEEFIDIFLPVLLEMVLTTCNFNADLRKEITLYTSCTDGARLRNEIIQSLRRFTKQAKVERISDLDLRLQDIEKIMEYKYLQLKYLQNEVTKSASPVNSFIFSREKLKKGKTPIFLPTDLEMGQLKYCQYLVSYFSEEIYMIKNERVIKLREKYRAFEELNELVSLIKRYFPMLDYIVVFGLLEKGVFSTRLVYTEAVERMYKVFEELDLSLKTKKIMCRNNNVRIRFDWANNEYLQLYKVETHPLKVDELCELKRCTLL